MKKFKNMKNIGRGKEVGEKPTTSHTPGETPAALADLADLTPNSVQFQILTAFLYYSPPLEKIFPTSMNLTASNRETIRF